MKRSSRSGPTSSVRSDISADTQTHKNNEQFISGRKRLSLTALSVLLLCLGKYCVKIPKLFCSEEIGKEDDHGREKKHFGGHQ